MNHINSGNEETEKPLHHQDFDTESQVYLSTGTDSQSESVRKDTKDT
jgi:hypothetical protein